jgi:iduronate 2-sulfatase
MNIHDRFQIAAFAVLTLCAAIADAAPIGDAPLKNILFIVADDLKASTVGCYGDELCQTPNIDRLASQGMQFTHAYAQGTACAPSRPSMMFSRYTRKRIDPDVHQSFPQRLKGAGFYSARVGKIFHMAVPNDIVNGTDGVDYPRSWTERFNCQGLEEATPGAYACLNQNIFQTSLENRAGAGTKDRMYVSVRMEGDGADQPDHKAADKAIELLRKHKDNPFVLAVGFVRPHYPMVAPKSFFDPYNWEDIEMPERRANDWDDIPPQGIAKFTSKSKGLDRYPDNQKRMWADYYASVSYMDAQLGKVLDELEALGLRDSTAIIFTSDHGYHLGEHDFWQKSNLHEEAMRVPLIVSAPGVAPGVSGAMVELADIYPTVMEFTGLDVPDQCDGLSLRPVLENPDVRLREFAFSYHGRAGVYQYALRSARWSYMYYGPGIEELYDMEKDPKQFTNLAKDPKYSATLSLCRDALARKRAGLG